LCVCDQASEGNHLVALPPGGNLLAFGLAVMAHVAGRAQGPEFCKRVVRVVVDVRCVQVDKVEVMAMLTHTHGAMGYPAVFAAIARPL